MNDITMGCDRISELPDCLLTHILSYLPTEDSVKTSVLSKRWESLSLEVSVLDLNANDIFPYGEALSSFMERFLEFNHGPCVEKFKIKYHRFTENYYGDCFDSLPMVEWITKVFHRGIQHLDVEKKLGSPGLDIMPKCVYVSKTLVSLKLVNVGLVHPNFVVSLPCLKILHLDSNFHVTYDGCGIRFTRMDYTSGEGLLIMEKLISGSPVLENLTMESCHSPWQEQDNSFWTNVPQCLLSTLEYVRLSKQIMKVDNGIKLVNYFLENSAVLKNLTLSCKHSHRTSIQETESYKKILITSTKLSPRCQFFVY